MKPISSLSAISERGRTLAAVAAQPVVASEGDHERDRDLGLDLDLDIFDDDALFAARSDMALGDTAEATPDGPHENGSGTGTFNVVASGNQAIDGLLSGVAWAGGYITYSFPDSSADYQAGHPELPFTASQLTAAQQLAAHFAMNAATYSQPASAIGFAVEGFTNLGIDYTSSQPSGTIRLVNSNKPGTAYAYYPSAGVWGGDAFFGPSGSNPVMGNYHWHTILHEIGHSLGLKHGQEAGNFGAMPAFYDRMEYTVMTYRSYMNAPLTGYTNETYGYAQTYMMYDIAALQYMYGADFTTNSGNTVYTWTPGSGNTVINGNAAITPGANRIFMTIWDGGGTDTYDASAYTSGVYINLAPGGYSLLSSTQQAYLGGGNYAQGNVYNALQYNGDARSLIENAIGGSGNDTLYGNAANNVLTGNGGSDYMWGSTGNDTLYGGAGNDTLLGSTGIDWLFGDDGNDYLTGDSETDYLFGGNGVDTMYGGTGDDWLYAGHGNTIDAINDGGAGTDGLYYGYFGLNGYTFDHQLNQIRNGAGVVVGTMAGIETLYGGSGNDIIISDGGGHTYYGLGGSDTMIAGVGAETMYGGAGIDTLDLRLWNGAYVLNMATGSSNYGGELYLEFERVLLGNGNDSVLGTANADTIDGGGGTDTMVGLGGNDVYYVNSSLDVVVEAAGGGKDLVNASSSYTLGAEVENLKLTGGGNWNGTGNSLNNKITGNSGNNVLDGLGGRDNMNGAGGADTLYGGGGNDKMKGGGGNDLLEGGSGNDKLTGGKGRDTLDGGSGADTLTGNAGADDFIYTAGGDVITDFQDDTDELLLDDALWGGGLTIAQVLATYASVVAGDTIFNFGGGNILTVENISNTSLFSNDIVFV